ncbi:MAG TPA: PDZ domain-containing protein [Myxococcota bacterium]|nr:PDZ domain-containing protein [Myxococcota bacterium]
MPRRSLAAATLVALLGCAGTAAPVDFEEARRGTEEARRTFVAQTLDSDEKEALFFATRRMTGADRWLIPLLIGAIDGRMGEHDCKLAARLLWEHFPKDAPAITEAKLATASERTAFALAEQQSRVGKLSPAAKRVLDKHMCAALEPGRWGVLLTKMKPEAENDLMNTELNDVSYACDGSPAARSGLKPGDTILLIDGERVRGDRVLAALREKSRATVHLRRGGVEQDIVISK